MNQERFAGCRIHPTALIEEGVALGEHTSVWDSVHIRHGAKIGRDCIVGEKTYIAYDVVIGNYCKLNASVYICAGVTISDYVMLAAHTVFTNDRFPRAFDRVLDGLASSDPNEETLLTHVGIGVTTGANVTIGPGITIGNFAMIGMGSVVTHDVPPYGVVIGNPARLSGYVCACGPVLVSIKDFTTKLSGEKFECGKCGRVYRKGTAGIEEIEGPAKVRHNSE